MPREYLARPDELRTVRTGNKLSVAIDHPSVNYQCRLIVPWLIQIRVIFASVVLYRPVFEGECMTYVSRPDASTSDGLHASLPIHANFRPCALQQCGHRNSAQITVFRTWYPLVTTIIIGRIP